MFQLQTRASFYKPSKYIWWGLISSGSLDVDGIIILWINHIFVLTKTYNLQCISLKGRNVDVFEHIIFTQSRTVFAFCHAPISRKTANTNLKFFDWHCKERDGNSQLLAVQDEVNPDHCDRSFMSTENVWAMENMIYGFIFLDNLK